MDMLVKKCGCMHVKKNEFHGQGNMNQPHIVQVLLSIHKFQRTHLVGIQYY